jgi:monoamine oxidase
MHPPALDAIGKIAIIGGGLAGLVAARRLHQAGIRFELIEARDRLGGRILSAGVSGAPSSDGFDLGPSWFWPEMQPHLAALVNELGLAFFRQHDEDDVIVQYRAGAAPERYPGNGFQQSASARLVGGTGALASALAAQLPPASIRMEATVRSLTQTEGGVDLLCTTEREETMRLEASRVVLALPPRLLAEAIILEPRIDGQVQRSWRQTPTWMAPHAKFFAVYERPFWREAGLSGAGRSMVGPLAEIHDATSASGQAALFGFVGVPAPQRAELGEAAIVKAAVEQLAAMFGPLAGAPKATLYKDWAADPLTATQDDLSAAGHPVGFRSPHVEGAWAGRLLMAGSEASSREPGYLAGAVDAAERAVEELM